MRGFELSAFSGCMVAVVSQGWDLSVRELRVAVLSSGRGGPNQRRSLCACDLLVVSSARYEVCRTSRLVAGTYIRALLCEWVSVAHWSCGARLRRLLPRLSVGRFSGSIPRT